MKFYVVSLCAAVAMGVCACGGTPTASTANPSMTGEAGSTSAAPAVGRGHETGTSVAAKPVGRSNRFEGDAPPADARFTLLCDEIVGPDHVLRAAALKAQLIASTGLTAWHIVHTEDKSSLFFGYYRVADDASSDPGEYTRAQSDLHRLLEVKNSQGERLFRAVFFTPVDTADPDAPPEWNLANASAKAYWSLQIAAYRGSPERKQAAVASVKTLRGMGVEAYYFHGDSISSVCVGAFPREAVKEQDKDHAQSSDETAPLLVVNGPLPPLTSEMYNKEGQRLTVIAPKLTVLDPALAKAIREFPDHSINGMTYGRPDKDGNLIRDASFLVVLPSRDGGAPVPPTINSARGGDAALDAAAAAAITDPRPGDGPSPADGSTAPPGLGRLRGLDH